MKNELTDESLMCLSNHLAQHMGINFSKERFGDLKAKMTALADAFDFDDLDKFTQWLLSDSLNREQIELLADFLTVGETYFFRDPKSFIVLENEILPQLIASRQKTRFMRIWSAACCTGEEPYSIAMLLNKMIADIDNWQITILGTDINPTFLERAEDGVYSDWSFRATPEFFKETFFKAKKNKFHIDPQIKKLVRFEWLNLAELERLADPNHSSMDIIFCRNVLIYFSNEHASQIITALSKCLTPNGYLFVGPNELPSASDKTFDSLHRSGAIILQKAKQHASDFGSGQSNNSFALTDEASALSDGAGKHHLSPGADSFLSAHKVDSADQSSPLETNRLDTFAGKIPSLEEAQDRYDRALYQEAAEMLLKRCQNGGDFSSLVLLAKSFANHSELKNALKWCDQAIKANRLNAATHYLRATILQEQGSNNEAMHSLKQALLMDSSFVLAEFNLGILHRQAGNMREAQRHFKSALKLLNAYQDDDILPESEGTTASGMRVIVSSLMSDTRR